MPQPTLTLSLDGEGWLLGTDPKNVGRTELWFNAPTKEAKPTRVPWIIQEAFPAYHGVAWYWRDFDAPTNPHPQGRCLLRFWAVDYLAEVWLNGVKVGGHEGGEGVFVLDVTDAIMPGKNRMAVRVLNPTNEPIDGIVLAEDAATLQSDPLRPWRLYNDGGIVDSVELLLAPAAYLTDLHLEPDPKTGIIGIRAHVAMRCPPRPRPIRVYRRAGVSGRNPANRRCGSRVAARRYAHRDQPAGQSTAALGTERSVSVSCYGAGAVGQPRVLR